MDLKEAYKEVLAKNAVLIDVREEEEVIESGIVEGAQFLPMSQLCESNSCWEKFKAAHPKNIRIFLYCRSGNRSGRVAEFLKMEGYDTENVGGFSEWVAAGLPHKKFP
ncbi:MAG: rhodanese-like domain-containing protein [Oligoflexia bacterium]|nr:rhodanese-like domain-containing protein [Oligoflexia bacterium]